MNAPRIAAVTILTAFVVLSTPAVFASSPSSAKSTATVYVVQALSQAHVSLSVDNDRTTDLLRPKEILDPLELTPGQHAMTFSGKNPDWKMRVTVNVPAGSSNDVVIHRPADPYGNPVVTTYHNDLASIAPDKGRVVVAHTAVVPPADILVNGKVVFANIANGEYATAEVPAGTLNVSIVPTGESSPVILGPLDLAVQPQVLTRVFAVGEPTNGSMDVIVQQLDLRAKGSVAPTTVPLGSAGIVSRWRVTVSGTSAGAAAGGRTSMTPLIAGPLAGGAAALLLAGWLCRPTRENRGSRRRDVIAAG